ncbi:MAG: hypothetical protein KF905_02950 [Flavobacteriales bacterium]|nr:hypothetical protein [Flavobacteriales bacterium]
MKGTKIIFWVLALVASNSQGQKPVDYAGKDFFQLRTQLRSHYDSLVAAGDSSDFHEGGDYVTFKKWEDFWTVRLKDGDTFEAYYSAYQAALQAMQSKANTSNSGDWHEVGPTDKPDLGLTSIGQGSQPGIGPIHFITTNPNDPDVMLCGSVIGGIYYTDDAGLNWSNAGSDKQWERSGCRHAVFKTGTSDTDAWFAASAGYIFWSGGIHRTTDNGITWNRIADQQDFSSNGGVWSEIFKLVTDPNDPDVLYAATSHTLWRTSNANDTDPTWQPIPIPIPPSVLNHATYGSYPFIDGRRVYDLEMHPTNSNVLYATVRYEASYSENDQVRFWRLMRTLDGGATWTEMPNQPMHTFRPGVPGANREHLKWDRNADHVTIEVSKAAGSEDALHVFYDLPQTGAVDELYRVDDAIGGMWGLPLRDSFKHDYGAGNSFGVSQENGQDIMIENSALELGRYSTYISGTWEDYGMNEPNEEQYHVDMEDFVSQPTTSGERWWMANHGGVHLSLDHGVTWEWRGKGLGVAEVHRMGESYSTADDVILGLYHDGNVLTIGAHGPGWAPDWKQLGRADGQQAMIDPWESQYMYWSDQNYSWFKSSDGGGTTSAMIGGWGVPDWNTEGTIDRGRPAAIYIPGAISSTQPNEIRRSLAHGATGSFEWISDFATLIGPGGNGIWRLHSAWSDPNYLYAYFAGSQKLYRTTMARGAAVLVQGSWQEMPSIPRTDVWAADIDTDFEDPDILYFTYSSSSFFSGLPEGTEMIFRVDYNDMNNVIVTDLTGSTNTWGALPNTGVDWESFTLERGSDGGMYVATDVGVYFLNEKLKTSGDGWQLVGTNLPHVNCKGLEISYQANRIRAGLVGRGLWEHNLWCPEDEDLTFASPHTSNAFVEVTSTITSEAVVDPGFDVSYRAGSEIRLTPGFHALAGAEFHAFIHPCDMPGNSFKSLAAGNENESLWSANEGVAAQGLLIFPNPSTGSFRIRSQQGSEIASVQAFDQTGRSIPISLQIASNEDECQVELRAEMGIYMLRVEFADGTVKVGHVCIER